jgi:hypothetical protein
MRDRSLKCEARVEQRGRAMVGWSPQEAMAMERRHILEGEKRVARQKALVGELIAKRYDRVASMASELLGIFQESLEFSRSRLRELESQIGDPSNKNSDADVPPEFAMRAARALGRKAEAAHIISRTTRGDAPACPACNGKPRRFERDIAGRVMTSGTWNIASNDDPACSARRATPPLRPSYIGARPRH